MQSYEAMAKTINHLTVAVAKRLGRHTSLINKWQEASSDFTDSGAYNPLDRLEAIIETVLPDNPDNAFSVIYWLAERFNLIVIPTPKTTTDQVVPGTISTISQELLKTIKEFSDLTQESSSALGDGKISRQESEKINKEGWELIRQVASYIQSIKGTAG